MKRHRRLESSLGTPPHRIPALTFATLLFACSAPQVSFEDQRAADHNRAGSMAVRKGELSRAALHFEQALEHARALADRRQQVDALNNLGIVHETLGERDRALEFYVEALEMARLEQDDDPFFTTYQDGVFSAALNRSRLLLHRGEIEAARSSLEEARLAADALGTRITRAAVRKQQALQTDAEGEPEAALELAREAGRLYEISPGSAENIVGLADTRLILGRLLAAQGDDIGAIAEYRAAARLAKEVSDRTLTAVALEATANSLARLGHLDDARIRYQMALDVNRRIPNVSRSRRNLLALREIGVRQQRADLIRECDELLELLPAELP